MATGATAVWRGAGARAQARRTFPALLLGWALPNAGVRGGGGGAVHPAVLPRPRAALLPGPGAAGQPHYIQRPQLPGVQPRSRREGAWGWGCTGAGGAARPTCASVFLSFGKGRQGLWCIQLLREGRRS